MEKAVVFGVLESYFSGGSPPQAGRAIRSNRLRQFPLLSLTRMRAVEQTVSVRPILTARRSPLIARLPSKKAMLG